MPADFEHTSALDSLFAGHVDLGYDTFWMAEHHFQDEGYECIPNVLMMAVHLAQVTQRIRIGCGFNVTPMWHPLRLAEDFATLPPEVPYRGYALKELTLVPRPVRRPVELHRVVVAWHEAHERAGAERRANRGHVRSIAGADCKPAQDRRRHRRGRLPVWVAGAV